MRSCFWTRSRNTQCEPEHLQNKWRTRWKTKIGNLTFLSKQMIAKYFASQEGHFFPLPHPSNIWRCLYQTCNITGTDTFVARDLLLQRQISHDLGSKESQASLSFYRSILNQFRLWWKCWDQSYSAARGLFLLQSNLTFVPNEAQPPRTHVNSWPWRAQPNWPLAKGRVTRSATLQNILKLHACRIVSSIQTCGF